MIADKYFGMRLFAILEVEIGQHQQITVPDGEDGWLVIYTFVDMELFLVEAIEQPDKRGSYGREKEKSQCSSYLFLQRSRLSSRCARPP